MRTLRLLPLLVLALIPFLAGCSSNNKGKIEGTRWRSKAGNVKGQMIPAGTLSLDFGKDGKLAYRAGPQTYTGTYSLGSGDNITLHLDQDLAGRKTHTEKITISGNQLTMTDSDGTQLVFEKN